MILFEIDYTACFRYTQKKRNLLKIRITSTSRCICRAMVSKSFSFIKNSKSEICQSLFDVGLKVELSTVEHYFSRTFFQ